LFRFLAFPGHCVLTFARQDFNISFQHYKRKRGDKPPPISTFVSGANLDLRLTIQPSIDVLAYPIFGETVALLDYALKLFALAVDLSEIVIGELAPLLFDLALSLFPIPSMRFQSIKRLREVNEPPRRTLGRA
jgi:hypothetical protein